MADRYDNPMLASTSQGLRIRLLGWDLSGGSAKGEAKMVIPVVVERMGLDHE
jgi:hypothetical protein